MQKLLSRLTSLVVANSCFVFYGEGPRRSLERNVSVNFVCARFVEMSEDKGKSVDGGSGRSLRVRKQVEEVEPVKSKRAKESKGRGKGQKTESKGEVKPDKKLMNKTDTDYSKVDFTNDKISASGNKWNFKIASWNVDGLRAWAKKGGMKYLEQEDPDILCLQEVKCTKEQLPSECTPEGYHCFWVSSGKDGYAGAGLLSKEEPLKVTYGLGKKEFDEDGRVITAEYDNFYLVNVYVPNAGRGLVTLPKRMSWDVEFRNYLKQLDTEKKVIICGDLNVSHKEIDLANPKTNTKNAGFTKEEREGMTQLLAEGFVDSYRHLYPDTTGAFTFWTYMGGARSRNVGWRLDYFLVSERMVDQICDNVIRNEVLGSDHCPITLFFNNK